MKFVVSTKSGKAYSASSEQDLFIGNKIGETVQLDGVGLTGFEARITGGSDKQGFPMSASLQGPARRKVLTSDGLGFRASKKGEKKRVSVRGNSISNEIAQVNLVVTKDGSVKIEDVLKSTKAPSPEDTMSAKEKAIKKSLEMAGSAEIGEAPTKKLRH